MTDKTAPDLAAAMSSLLEQELMAASGISTPPATATAVPTAAMESVAMELGTMESGAVRDRLQADVLAIAATALRMAPEQLDPTENLANFGVDSIAITEIMASISRAFGIAVAPTTFFEARNLNDLARILEQRHGQAITGHYARQTPEPAVPPPPVAAAGTPPATDNVAAWLSRHRALRQRSAPPNHTATDTAPVAVIAMAGRFPQSPDIDALDAHLRAGDDCITEVPPDRWDWRTVWGDPHKGPYCDVKYGGFVDGVDLFDAKAFHISPHEAELMDPQHRLFMECVWSLIESAGYAPGSLAGKRIGLFVGVNLLDYTTRVNRARVMDAQQMTGLGHAFCSNRLSFLLDIHGPSQTIDTACSSSAVALHRAVMSIRHEGCEMAIAGGTNLMLGPDQHVLFSQLGMLSHSGRCHAFGAGADGYVRADGVGAVLLKRLDLAERDGDPIWGVIRACVEHHGGLAPSLTAPNPKAQAELIVQAWRQAGADPRTAGLMECHGTGTTLGDPVEIEGLKSAFATLYGDRGLEPPAAPHCGLGSVKSNIGHTETTAGIAGLIKVLLALRSATRYRSLHCQPANPLIDLAGTPFALLNEEQPWPRPVVDGVEHPRRAGLSSFGAGGTNVHCVIEEYRPAAEPAAKPGPRPLVIPVSARSEAGLRQAVAALLPFAASSDLDDFAYTLQTGRDPLRVRVAFVVRDNQDLARQMAVFLKGEPASIAFGKAEKKNNTPITTTDPTRLAALWVAGGEAEWQPMSSGRRRLRLPPTPFESKRHWLELDPASPPAAAPSPTRPSPAELTPVAESPDRWRLDMTGHEFFLTDHRLGEVPVLPGVAYLELARNVAEQAGFAPVSLCKVVWLQPLRVTAPTTIDIALDRAAKRIEIASRDVMGATILHAQIHLASTPDIPVPAWDIAALQQTCTTRFEAPRIYDIFAGMGLNYGPSHRAIRTLATGPGPQVLARLEWPETAGPMTSFGLHPSLLDGAFQAAVGMTLDSAPLPHAAALPFAIDTVDILGPCTPVMWVHIRPAATAEAAVRVRSLDLDLTDESGGVRVRLRGFATRLPAVAQPRPDLALLSPVWQPAPPNGLTPARSVVLNSDLIADPALGLGDRYTALALALLHQAQNDTALIQLVLKDGPQAEPLGGLAGLLRSVGHEPGCSGGQLLTVPADLDDTTLAARLEEAAALPAGSRLRLEDGRWWRETWQPVTTETTAATPWHDGQVILITGGAGGLGRLLTAEIRAHAPAATIVLTGRQLSAQAQSWLTDQGDEVEFVPCDITDGSATTALVAEIRHRHGRLDGVIHAAGVLRDAPLARKTPEELATVLAPKVTGTINLDRAIGDATLDFFVLFSSVAAALGNPGQADYAAANGFMDGFAQNREVRRRAGLVHGRTLAMAWPLWAEGGMTLDAAGRTLMTRTTGLVPLPTDDGWATLATGLATDQPRLLVAVGDVSRLRRRLDGDARPDAPATATTAASIPLAALTDKLRATLTQLAARYLKVAPGDLADDEELSEYGFDSIGFTQFANLLNDQLDLELTPTLFFEHPTLAALARHLAESFPALLAAKLGVTAEPPSPPPVPTAIPLRQPASGRDDSDDSDDSGIEAGIAVIGMSCQFPGAADIDAFWRNLEQGRDCTSEIPPDRWDWRAMGTVARAGLIEGIGQFDPGFFSLSAPEARMMDPQQRLLLIQSWRLFEDAGIAPRRLSGSDTGVFIGIADSGYGRLLTQAGAGIEGYAMTGLAPSLGPNRISFTFNLHGPSVAVETACSSALVAVHRAVEAIRAGTCEAAIAGGINLLLLPDSFIGFAKAGMLAADGRCKPFSAEANGYGRGEGVGLVLLKRLSAAKRDGNRIIAVIRASGENHGGRASSLTAPNPEAQANLLRGIYNRAGFDPRSVSYVEAHGTGTPLGDPIEVQALRAAFTDLARTAQDRFGPAPAMACGLGSVKANIGHLELAAGIAGLIKVLLQLRHGTLAPTLHCEHLNPYLKLEDGPFEVVRQARSWTRPRNFAGQPLPLRAGVSSFGFGGANAHVVVEEYQAPPSVPAAAAAGPCLLVLSAHSAEALMQMARDLKGALSLAPLTDIAHTLQTAREGLEYRLAFTAMSAAEAELRLAAFLTGETDPALYQGRVKTARGAVSVLESDPEVAAAIAGLASRGRAEGLLEVWTKGFDVNWPLLYPGNRPGLVKLPGYPFATTTFWPETTAGTAIPRQEASRPHPPEPENAIVTEPPAEADSVATALAAVSVIAAQVLEVETSVLDPDAELGEFGFDSITMTGFAAKVNEALGLSLTPADFFEFATLNRLAGHIATIAGATAPRPVANPRPAPPPPSSPILPLTASVPMAMASASASVSVSDDAIAIVGLSCHFPQAPDADAFWDNLKNGRDSVTRIPADRWDWRALDGNPKTDHAKTNIHWGAFIDGVFDFDPLFFGISPREAKLMDPQQRLLMTHVWKALEDAGHAPRSLAGRQIGLFAGTSSSGYRDTLGDDTGAEGYVSTGAVPSIGPNRVSFFFDWHGPSEPVETACSSSLVALHRAIQSMRAGDCEMAVVGGVNTIVTPDAHINFAKAGMLAPDGRCKTFSAQANGYGRGEGIGVVVLRRLSDALAEGDRVLALIRSTAINHGGRANSLTAPNTAAQTSLLRQAMGRAGLDPASIGYIEAHGTGTALGDPVEINALKAAFGSGDGSCGIGSVKTNVGHMELAAGMAGLIKVLLQMQHRTLVPSLHCDPINPYVDLAGSPFHIVRTLEPWRPRTGSDGQPLPLRAGISSFGFGGVNAHVIVESYEAPAPVAAPHAGPLVMVLSAHDLERLKEQAGNLLAHIDAGKVDAADLPDMAFTLQVGRDALKHRLALVVTSLEEFRQGLTAFLAGDLHATARLAANHRPGSADIHLPPQQLAAQWLAGHMVDWQALYPEPRRRLRLPTYAFARDHYRLESNFSPSSAASGDYTLQLTADDFVLADHRINGQPILPGAMGLELARTAFAAGSAFTPTVLSRVVWQHPLRLNGGSVTVTVPLEPGQDGAKHFRLLSDGPHSAPHMMGMIAPLSATHAVRMDPAAIRNRCQRQLAVDDLYRRYTALGLEYGPAFRAMHDVFAGDAEVLARLELPAAAQAPRFGLHPCMLDAAFQAAIGLFPDTGTDGTALPFALDRAEILAPTTHAMWAHVRHAHSDAGSERLDIDLADAEGTVRVRLHGFSLRRIKTPARQPASDLTAAARAHLSTLVAQEAAMPVSQIEAEAALEAYGIDSVMIVHLTDRLEQDFGSLPKTLFFDFRTVAALADYFATHHAERLASIAGAEAPPPPAPRPVSPAVVFQPPSPSPADTAIAIIGMAGRFPEARDLAQFWRNLEAGRDCIREIPPERWDHSRFFDPRPGIPGKTNSKWGGFLDEADRFDPLFFNISPREAEYMDPQERLFLQCAWETLEDAGYSRTRLPPAAAGMEGADVGVFVGVMYEEYQLFGAERTQAGQPLALSSSAASIANRVSAFCGLHGPSLAVDSMCSSSLSAIHLACQALQTGSCQAALAGGVNLTLHPNKYLALSQGRFLSSSGRCESFGRGGNGYVPGEGVGAVLLKPLARAEADGDRILGVIRASALNHGGHTNGYTVPNPAAQTAVITKALLAAKVNPRAISYVEAHGTGTSLGDPIEIAALTRAFAAFTSDTGFCAIGSVKSNVGHCESAAGMAGLAKILLQMRHGRLVPSLHAETLNPGIDFGRTPFVVQRQAAPWPRPTVAGQIQPRLAGLSSFGAGGANAHLIIEEYVAKPEAVFPLRPLIFPLSARDPARLDEAGQRLCDAVASMADDQLAAIAWTLQTGREAFEERRAIVASTRAELLNALRQGSGARGRARRGQPAVTGEATAIAAAWVQGADVDWQALWPAERPHPLGLPTYPFARERYWVPGSDSAPAVTAAIPRRLPLFFVPHWQAQPATRGERADRVLVVLCAPPPGAEDHLRMALAPAQVMVLPPASFADHAARLLALLQDLFRQRPAKALVQLVVEPDSSHAGLAGLLRCARLERPGLACQCIALDLTVPEAANLLLADQASPDTDIRHTGRGRLVRQWRELTTPAHVTAPWRDDGIYLVTGGAGGVGRHVWGEILARTAHAEIWLTGRSSGPTDLPERVHYVQADVTDTMAMDRLVTGILARHGRLNGVIHAAGLTRDMLLVRKTETDLRAVLAPKVDGALALDAATRHCSLDFMLLFASAAGALGNGGQADYAAANAFLDAFASQRNRLVAAGERSGHTLAIDWPYWRDGGMRLEDSVIAAMEQTTGILPLDAGSALAALAAALSLPGNDQILVLDGTPDRVRALLQSQASPPLTAPAESQPARPRGETLAMIRDSFAAVLKIPAGKLLDDEPFDRFGMDSVAALEIIATLERRVGPLPPSLLFEHPTIARLATALDGKDRSPGDAPQPEKAAPPAPVASDIAIIAVAGRYPGADNPEALWQALESGRDLVTEVPTDRFDPAYDTAKGKPGASHCKWGGFLADVDRFDAAFFGYSPRAADLADPQERLFLETTWHLLERAGHTRAHLRGNYDARVGVFVGAMYQHYGDLDADPPSRPLRQLASYSAIANRISFFFDLQGPSVAVDSMCSSALQAVHQACQSLRSGECRLAIAGGVNLSLHNGKYIGLSQAGLAGSSADSRSFADGDGYLPAEGVGAVLLKPLADALRDKDAILAVIKASTANHGGHSAGFGVPSADAQARLIEDNIRTSGIDPRTIGYVEAAATGAALGDSIELRALTRAFQNLGLGTGTIALGSVKSNMGHAEAASGMAQLTKVLLQLQHGRLVPSLRPSKINPALDFAHSPFHPQWVAAHWPEPVVNGEVQPRRATISSFGAGGSNVHLVIEQAPPRATPADTPRQRRFPVSARTPGQLEQRLRDLAEMVRTTPDLSLAALSATLRRGREEMEQAVTIIATRREDLAERLGTAHPGDATPPCAEPDEDWKGPMLVLPPYPFARDRHWLPSAVAGSQRNSAPLDLILGVIAAETGVAAQDIDADAPLPALGVDSMVMLRLLYAIEDAWGLRLERHQTEAHPTPRALARFMAATYPTGATATEPPVTAAAGPWHMPLTEGQKGLWVLHRLHPDSTVYNVPVAFRVEGLDEIALEQAWTWLLDAFPVLTARIVDEDEPSLATTGAKPILARLEVPKGMDPLDFARQRTAQPFDLECDAPCRMELLRGGALGGDHAILLLVVHHLVFDGASAAIAAGGLWDAYARFSRHQPPPPRPDAADFTQFGQWERDFLASPRGRQHRDWWRQCLAGELPVIALPADRPAQPGAAIDGRNVERTLSAEMTAAVRATASRLGTSPAALLLAVLAALVYRHTGQGDMVIGVPFLRRPSRRFARSVGYFVNMLAVRAAVTGSMTATQLIRDTHRRLGDALDHGEVPFPLVARDLGGSLHGDAPYQIGFAYQNFPLGETRELPAGSGHATFVPQIRQPGDSLFGIEVHEDGDILRLVAGYDGARFDTTTIDHLLDRFTKLTASFCANPETPVAGLDMMAAVERKRLTGRRSNPPAHPRRPGLVADWIKAQAKTRPNGLAVTAGDEMISYRRLVRHANRLTRFLSQHGVTRGSRVAVLLDRDGDSIALLLACLSLGAVWVPLDPEAPPLRLNAMIADCRPAALVTHGPLPPALAATVPVLDLGEAAKVIAALPSRAPKVRPKGRDPAYMIYTSGSTGTPKGVLVSQRALANHIQAIGHVFALTPEDVVLHFAPQVVDTALEQILPPLVAGARLLMRTGPAWSPDDLRRILSKQRVSIADLPPAYLREVLLAWDGAAPPSLRLLVVGGETLSPDTVRLWQDGPLAGIRLLNAYGPTEATITSLIHDVAPNLLPGRAVPIGRPLPGTRVAILDRDGTPVPDGVIGELYLGGNRLALGYHGRPDLTAERFTRPAKGKRLYRTGDLASFIPGSKGVIAFHGRMDHQLKIRGFRVELGEIETALAAFGLRQWAVVPCQDAAGGQILVAYVVPAGPFDEEALRLHMAQRLPPAMLPTAYVPLAELPQTRAGKLDRAALPAPQAAGRNATAPRDDVETTLRTLWAKVLGRDGDEIGIHDDFALCGGHSLLWVRLLAEIGRAFACTASNADFLAAQTIAEQAAILRPWQQGRAPAATPVPGGHDADCLSLRPAITGPREAPLFLVHGATGTAAPYVDLARRLNPAIPVYGLQAPAGDMDDLRTLAAYHVKAVRRIQRHGPYALAGWSLGGVLALEMARQLRHDGEAVSLLFLLDSYPPALLARIDALPSNRSGDPLAHAFLRDLFGLDCDVTVPQESDITTTLHAIPAVAAHFGVADRPRLRHLFETYRGLSAALSAYRPEPVDIPITLLRAGTGDQWGDCGWESLAPAGLDIHTVPGDHASLLRPPNLEVCAALLDAALARRPDLRLNKKLADNTSGVDLPDPA